MRFMRSEALFPSADLSAVLGTEYAVQCLMLCYGPPPSWEEVMVRFRELRDLL